MRIISSYAFCKTCSINDYTEWDYEKKSCPKCVDGVIGEEESGIFVEKQDEIN